MPKLPTIRVIGSPDISTSCGGWVGASSRLVSVLMVLSPLLNCLTLFPSHHGHHVRWYPVVSSLPLCRHEGSLLTVSFVNLRRPRGATPQYLTALVDSLAPGGSSISGRNLSGKPGIVQPMQIPPTWGQPPIPFIQPRLGTLQFTTGPQQPNFTIHLGDPYSVAKSPCS